MKLLEAITKLIMAGKTRGPRLRDPRGHHASSALDCLRDQYWKAKGVPETNPSDVKGTITMLIGSAVENELARQVFSNLHLVGIHLLGTQVPVGGSKPDWDGYLDVLLGNKDESGKKQYVIEVKTVHGFGADKLYNERFEKDSHLAQIGLYLRDCHQKGVTRFGKLFYVLLSDRNFGQMVVVNVEYIPATEEVVAYSMEYLDKPAVAIDVRMNIRERVLSRWEKLEYHLATDTVPAPEYHYKKPLTPEFLRSVETSDLKKAYAGEKILGDWNVRYSHYFDKQMQVDGISREYTAEELELIRLEHNTRKTEKGNSVRKIAAPGEGEAA